MTERDHLDPATIAALVDRTLDAAPRAAAEAHLAACADCREVWVETSEMAEAMSGATAAATANARATVIPHRPRSRRWVYSAAGLAAAAAVVLAVFLPQLVDRGASSELTALVEAVGENRRTEGRLSGGFKWGAVPSVTRGTETANDADVNLAIARLQKRVGDSDDPALLAVAGLASLAGGDAQAGLSRLRQATQRDAGNAAAWSDLSAAYMELGRLSGDGGAYGEALNAADRALALAPGLAEARFNRALALSRLGRHDDARTAWERYLELDSSSGWADEARQRLSAGRSSRYP